MGVSVCIGIYLSDNLFLAWVYEFKPIWLYYILFDHNIIATMNSWIYDRVCNHYIDQIVQSCKSQIRGLYWSLRWIKTSDQAPESALVFLFIVFLSPWLLNMSIYLRQAILSSHNRLMSHNKIDTGSIYIFLSQGNDIIISPWTILGELMHIRLCTLPLNLYSQLV